MSIASIGGGDKTPAIQHLLNHQQAEKAAVLIIPSACSIPTSYAAKVPKTIDFFADLGVASTVLHEFNEAPSITKVQHELGRATLIYTIGGNSPHMLKLMREHGSDQAITEALLRGVNHAGVSAGALLPFAKMQSNVSARPAKEEWDFAYLDGLGVLQGVAGAHAGKHDPTMHGERPDSRIDSLISTMPIGERYGIAIDDGAAVVFGEAPAIIASQPEAQAYLLERMDDRVIVTSATDVEQLKLFVP